MTTPGTGPSSRWVANADAYDAWFDRPWGAYAMAVEHRLLLGAVALLAGLSVCDAGCGTGRLARRLSDAGAAVVAVDRDRASLTVAARRVECPMVVGDVHALPFADAAFDATFAATVCEFTADPAATISELVRVTRPGGCVVIGALSRRSPWGWWNRAQFDEPPWNGARFLDRAALEQIGRRHGTTTWHTGLYVPRALPGVRRWGRPLERVASRLVPGFAAFGVLTVCRPPGSPRSPLASAGSFDPSGRKVLHG
jgi:SAM-dependent methyltransferase